MPRITDKVSKAKINHIITIDTVTSKNEEQRDKDGTLDRVVSEILIMFQALTWLLDTHTRLPSNSRAKNCHYCILL